MTQPRYLWGGTKVGHVDFTPRTPPPGKAGRMYFDSIDSQFKFCVDGTSFLMLRDVLHN